MIDRDIDKRQEIADHLGINPEDVDLSCEVCEDWDCEGDCEEREQEALDRLAYGDELGSKLRKFDPHL